MKKFAVVFPGQGSQSIGMLSSVMDNEIVKDTYDKASEALGYDMRDITLNGPLSELNKTEVTQPAILTASIAAFRLFSQSAHTPSAFAGHSLGEYSALVAAGALDFSDAVRLVRLRGQAMQEAVPQGKGAMMAVLGLDDDVILECCKEATQGDDAVWAANFNSVGQVVISGAKDAVARAGELLTQKGARRVVALSVSAPSHCPLMQEAANRLEKELSCININDINVPVYANAYAKPVMKKDDIVKALILQLTGPVRWVETVVAIKNDGIECIIEAGPGKVLAGLNKRIDKTLGSGNVFDMDSLQKSLEIIA